MSYIIVVCFLISIISPKEATAGDDNPELPPVYQMDDFRSCQRKNGLYCKLILKVVPNNTDNEIWKTMEKIRENPLLFRRDIIYRYKCISENLERNWEIKQLVTKQENGKLENFSLSVQIIDMNCRKFERISLTSEDKTFLFTLFIYISIVIAATIFHVRMQNAEGYSVTRAKAYFLCFSIKRGWEIFLQKSDNSDSKRLRSFNGLRALGMLNVILGHSLMSIIVISIKNPIVLENLFTFPSFRMIVNFGMNFVQVFYLISAWLLASGLDSMYLGKNPQKLSVIAVITGIGIRFFRLIGPLALMVGLSRTNLYKLFENGPQGGHIQLNHEKCQSNALATLLFVNNQFYSNEQCYFISWYLAVDFQLFLATFVLVYIALKYKLRENQIFSVILFFFGIDWIYNAYVIYKHDLPVSVGTTIEKSKLEVSLSSYETFAMHTSLYINTGGYVVGLFAGVLYNRLKNKDPKYAKTLLKFSLITPFIIFLSIFDYSPMMNGIIGASLKPLFNVGLSCLVFGVVFSKKNGPLKKFFEWEYFEYIAKISYSVYLVHYWICFGREMLFDEVIEISYFKILAFYLTDIIISVPLGLVLFILFECPIRGLLGVSMKRKEKKDSKTS